MIMRVQGKGGSGEVTVDGKVLDPEPSRKLRDHSPTGFAWGYSGSGPAQLSIALLLHAGIDRKTIYTVYQTFKREVVAGLPQDFDVDLDIHEGGYLWRATPH